MTHNPAVSSARITSVHIRLTQPLLLSQAAGGAITVNSPELVLSWIDTLNISVRGLRGDAPHWARPTVNARSRTLTDLESTNPGLSATLRALVPQAPWPAPAEDAGQHPRVPRVG